MRRPGPRGPLSAALLDALTGSPGPVPEVDRAVGQALAATGDVLADEDLQLALFLIYELAYRGIDGVDDAWEWAPELLRVRGEVERVFEDAVRRLVPVPDTPARSAAEVAAALFELTSAEEGPSLSSYIARRPPTSSCASSSCTGRSTTSRRPTRTAGPCPGSVVGPSRH